MVRKIEQNEKQLINGLSKWDDNALDKNYIIMIARIWHGRTKSGDADSYRQYVIETGMASYRSTKGNIAAQIWQQQEGDIMHIYTLSWWDSYESIKSFAGEDFEKAKYYDKDEKYLLEFEPTVQHYECWDFR